MKLIQFFIVSVFTLVLGASIAFAQGSKAETKKDAKVYACEQCHVATMKPSKCACGAEMKAINAKIKYSCDKHEQMADKPGNCHGKAMKKTAVTYGCDKCHTTSVKPGKCGCGAKMKEHKLKVM